MPNATPFPFQQNPCTFPNWETTATDVGRVAEIEEAAADMFLNWVYRTITNISPLLKTEVPGSWSGYRNMDWRNNAEANDDSYPGDARLEWMQIVMDNIFDEKGW
jgi:hypothetical protein